MNDEKFDKELSSLYQQRKAQIVAPNIKLGRDNKKSYSIFKLLPIFAAGSLVSFTIMAIISHLAKSPEKQSQSVVTQHQINIEKDDSTFINDEIIEIKPLPPLKPKAPLLVAKKELPEPLKNEIPVDSVEKFGLNTMRIVALPHLDEPEYLNKPIHKVLPKVSRKSLKDQQSGSIRLRYGINGSGNVENIEVIDSNVSRELQRAAKIALAKWRYSPTENTQRNYEIIFEFNPIK